MIQEAQDERPWRHFYFLTPLFNGWTAVFVAFFYFLQERIRSPKTIENLENVNLLKKFNELDFAGIITGIILIIFIFFYLDWRFTTFRINPTSLDFRRGIFFKSNRRIPYESIQRADISQRLSNRFVGVASVNLQIAGGGEILRMAYLKLADAEEMKADILAKRVGFVEKGPGDKPVQDKRLVHVSLWKLVISLLLDSQFLIPLFILLLPFLLSFAVEFKLLTLNESNFLGLLLIFTPMALAALPAVISRIILEFNFTSEQTAHGFKESYGLIAIESQTIPYNRVQSLTIIQPLLWVPLGWWRIQVNVLGKQVNLRTKSSSVRDIVLPVGNMEDTKKTLECILSGWSNDAMPELAMEMAHEKKAVAGSITLPKRAMFLSPITAHRRALRVGEDFLMVRGGYFERYVSVMPLRNVQVVKERRGLLQRALSLGTLKFGSAGGKIQPKISNLDVAEADVLFEQENQKIAEVLGHNVSAR